jgi:diaminopimelate epimerase
VSSKLYKLEGAGNDFLLAVEGWAGRFNNEPDLVRRLCDRRRGLGADGTLAIEVVSTKRVRLEYRNADGSEGAFCANGTRCAARAAVELFGCASELVVETGWAEVPAEVTGSQVSLEIPMPERGPTQPDIEALEDAAPWTVLELGVPHLVAEARGVSEMNFAEVAPRFRNHPALGAEGANVDLYEIADDGTIEIRTWERGVEGETLSCGSGMVAVALLVMAHRSIDRVELLPRSGDRLVVEALGRSPQCATRLTGPTRFVATIELSEDLLRDL